MSKSKTPIIAIVGRANVGKSSIFNLLAGYRRVITAKEAGTTRDSIAELIDIKDSTAWLVDTAGLKTATDDFELSIQEQIEQAMDSADLVMVVIEADSRPDNRDRQLAKLALKSKKKVLLVANKVDRNLKAQTEDFLRLGIKEIVLTSTTTRRGMNDLIDNLRRQLPDVVRVTPEPRIAVAILGRPNVGKSTLFNALVKKQKAVVAEQAGTTRDLNKQIVHYHQQAIELVDTAGIRKSGKIEVGVEKFSVLKSLAAIEASDICLLITDGQQPATLLDQKIAGLISEAGKGLILVVSKWDLVDKDGFTHDQLLAELRESFNFIAWAPVIFTSGQTGQNVSKLFGLILEITAARMQEIKTNELNRWLIKAVAKHPPAGVKNKRPKLKYVVQTGSSPPSFTFFGNNHQSLHWSYKRFLERELRDQFGFQGTALKLLFRAK